MFPDVFTQFGYESNLIAESLLASGVRKLPNYLKAIWLTYLQKYDSCFETMRVLNGRIKTIPEVQDNLKMQFGTAEDKSRFRRDKPKAATFTSDVPEKSDVSETKYPFKNGDYKFWFCPLFRKMTADERGENRRKLKLCFCCLSGGHRASQFSLERTCGKDGLTKKHHRLLDRNERTQSKSQIR